MNKRSLISFVVFAAFFVWGIFFAKISFAKIGVGVGTAKIELNEDLKPGGIYSMPSLTVRNTGDEASAYSVGIQYHEGVPEHRPQKEWFEFGPREFDLGPGETQVVQVTLRLPVKLEPGKYFAYVEASPAKTSENSEGAVIGIAAAAKLYFTVIPANIWQAFYYKIIYLWKFYAPWTYAAAAILVALALVVIFGRLFTFDIGFKRKSKSKKDSVSFEKHSSRKGEDAGFEDVFIQALSEVEKYAANFTHSQAENIFQESAELKPYIVSFFRYRDSRVLSVASPELKNILLLSRNGLDKIEREYPQYSSQALEKVVSGLVG
ncbi:MAG: hypothetical protein QG620_323 [Patescibacteria group bacterium]|nr:hypothetical protein [Patescibacteria group bacterium]